MAGDRARVSYDPSRKWRGLHRPAGPGDRRGGLERGRGDRPRRRPAGDARRRRPVGTPDGGYARHGDPQTGGQPAGGSPTSGRT